MYLTPRNYFAPELQKRLDQVRERVDELTAIVETVRDAYGLQLEEQKAIQLRLTALEVDLKRNQDALKLKRLGRN